MGSDDQSDLRGHLGARLDRHHDRRIRQKPRLAEQLAVGFPSITEHDESRSGCPSCHYPSDDGRIPVDKSDRPLPVSTVRPVVALDHPIRNTRRVYAFSIYAWLWAGAMILVAAIFASRFAATEPLGVLAGALFFIVLALAYLWYGQRIRRDELRVGAQVLVIRNPIRCYTIPLSEVDRFQPGNVTAGGNNGTPGIVVRLNGGRQLPVWALAQEGSIFSIKRKTLGFAPLADDLNGLLSIHRSSLTR